MLALHPEYLAERSDPKAYIDDLRRRMDEVSAQSPEIGARDLTRAQQRLDLQAQTPRFLVPGSRPETGSAVPAP